MIRQKYVFCTPLLVVHLSPGGIATWVKNSGLLVKFLMEERQLMILRANQNKVENIITIMSVIVGNRLIVII